MEPTREGCKKKTPEKCGLLPNRGGGFTNLYGKTQKYIFLLLYNIIAIFQVLHCFYINVFTIQYRYYTYMKVKLTYKFIATHFNSILYTPILPIHDNYFQIKILHKINGRKPLQSTKV